MNATIKVYFDMDGVLAQFEQVPHAVERFAVEEGFFKRLEATTFAKQLLKMLDDMNTEHLYILTASPHEAADQDKRDWVLKHLPGLHDKVITVRSGEEKAKLASGGNILVDDYTENLKNWVKSGGEGIKALNGFNGRTKRYKSYTTGVLVVD